MEVNEKNILLVSISVFIAILFISSFVYREIALFINLLIVGIMVIILPYSIYKFIAFKNLKNCEDEFPNFLRDLAAAKRSGLSLIQAIKSCSSSNYGMLTKEIVRLNNQLTWNIPLKKALKSFRERLKQSSIISHSIIAISQIEESGGKTEDIMDSLADNVEGIKETEAEKKALMSQHITAMYAIFFIFLGIAIALISFLLQFAELPTESEFGAGIIFGGSPCKSCINATNINCLSCNIFFNICSAFDFGRSDSPKCYYKSLFFMMIIIQGIFSGLIAGQIGSESVVAGVKHSLIMAVSGFIIFLTASSIGFI